MEYQNILLTVHEKIATLTVNRPQKLNAVSSQVLSEIGAAAQHAASDRDIGVLIVTGAGEKAFVAGADIAEMSSLDAAGAKAFSEHAQRMLDALEACPKPVIAAVNGYALGGGTELALACHIRICSTNARFGQPEVALGLMPGAGGTRRLSRVVGRAAALHMILTGDQITAEEAMRIGLVSKVVEPGELMATAEAIARTILSRAPLAVRYALEAVRRGAEMPLSEAFGLESSLFGLCCATEDMKEGTSAFVRKAKPSFKGR